MLIRTPTKPGTTDTNKDAPMPPTGPEPGAPSPSSAATADDGTIDLTHLAAATDTTDDAPDRPGTGAADRAPDRAPDRPGTSAAASRLDAPNVPLALAGALAATALGVFIQQRHGLDRALLFGLGLGLGVTLFHARFGFTSAWRQLAAVGQGRGLQAHTLMLAVAVVLFAPILAGGVGLFGSTPAGYVAPITLGLVAGSVLFGIGMQLGGACASGTLYATGSGHVPVFITLGGFLVGSVLGVRTVTFWQPGGTGGVVFSQPISLAERFGTLGGVAISLLLLGTIAVVAEVVIRRRQPPPIAPVPSTVGLARIVRGSWPLWVGALVLAGLNAAVLLVSGRPWGVTGAFRLWGSKLLGTLGISDPATWPGWQGNPAIEAPILTEATSLTNLGIIAGAFVAAAIAGSFTLHQRTPRNVVAAHSVGGVAMGYGAAIAFGCNIGAYFSGIASMSVHGWLWGGFALVGTFIGLRLRPLFGLSNPKPADSVC